MRQKLFSISIVIILALAFYGLLPAEKAVAAVCTWVGSTNDWVTIGNWTSCDGGFPQSDDDVVFHSGASAYPIITLPVALQNITIDSGASLTVGSGGSLDLDGNFICNGTFSATGRPATFSGVTDQTVSGDGTATFGTITINSASANNIVNISMINTGSFNADVGFLTLTQGILEFSGTYLLEKSIFSISDYVIGPNTGIWLNNPNVSITAALGSSHLQGRLHISTGIYNVGDDANESLVYESGSSLVLDGGTLNVAGYFAGNPPTGSPAAIINITGGVFTVGKVEVSSPETATFTVGGATNMFINGGTVVIQNENKGTGHDLNIMLQPFAEVFIYGGTIQFGNGSTDGSPSFEIASQPLPSIEIVSNGNTPSVVLYHDIEVWGNVLIGANTILNANNRNINIHSPDGVIPGNWINNGAFTCSTCTVLFDSPVAETIGGTNSTTFNHLYIFNSSSSGVILASNPTVNGDLFINTGRTLNLSTYDITVVGTLTNNGTLKQTKPVNSPTGAVEFLHITDGGTTPVTKYRGVDITTASNLGIVTVSLRGNAGTTCTTDSSSGPYAPRCYYIQPEIDGSGTVTLWALTGEIPGTVTDPRVFRFSAGTWHELSNPSNGTDTGSYSFVQGDTPGFSAFLFGQQGNEPTVISIQSLAAINQAQYGLILSIALVVLFAVAAVLYIAHRRQV